MSWQGVLIFLLVVACFALIAWVVVLHRRPPRTVVREVPRVVVRTEQVQVPVPREVVRVERVEVPREVVRVERVEVPVKQIVHVPAAEPVLPLDEQEYLAEPQALPDVPDAVHDSVLDGARLGGLVVRGASIRGDLARSNARLRRQTMAIALLNRFHPPVLLSAVAAGSPDGDRSQVGAAQVCRSVRVKVSDRAKELDAAWAAAEPGDPVAAGELNDLLREVTLALTDSLLLTAGSRNQPPAALATELTCVLSRLGDTQRRSHLVFGVGAGTVLRYRAGAEPETVFAAVPAALPQHPDQVTWRTFTSHPDEAIVLCTATTREYLTRQQVHEQIAPLWTTDPPPSQLAFLAQVGRPHQAYGDDRTAIGLWAGERVPA